MAPKFPEAFAALVSRSVADVTVNHKTKRRTAFKGRREEQDIKQY